ncbi:MAG: tRNA guanosine(15) transglycosylase TgtA [Candidatus Thermoplasmatota archaeon]|nr:tRNA guanosine(15) transglycosylase TgtA [Candidatus Thermoplasmatota archaeon]
MKFEIKERDAAGRICRFTTPHGTVTTPNLMPVINPNKLLITPQEMRNWFHTEILITNSYIINKHERLHKEALSKGVHKLIKFDGAIMTDSGTFQSYVYGDVAVDPLEIVAFQRDIGSDIGTILDVFGTPDQTKAAARQGIGETVKRAKASVPLKGEMALACPIQGSIYPELRQRCAQQVSNIDADFFPIGGVVPLMENQRYTDLVKVILASKKGLTPAKPVHLFGAGHPLIFPLAVALGCDFFDSSAYAKYAQDERMIFYWGTEKLEDMSALPCSCPVCSNHTAAELKELERKERIVELAKHNLYVSYEEINKIKHAISTGTLWELVERRATCNPYLLEAMNVLRIEDHKSFLEYYEPVSKPTALFYTGSQTIHRPGVYRLHTRLFKRFRPSSNQAVAFPEGKKPYSAGYEEQIKKIRKKNTQIAILIDSHLGPVPLELDEMYPYAQSVFPKISDIETEDAATALFDSFTKNMDVLSWKGNSTLTKLKTSEKEVDRDAQRISAVCDMQFGRGCGDVLLGGDIAVVKSKKTDKIRNVYCNGRHILSMRASDGLFTLKLDGAKILHKKIPFPLLRVVVHDDAVPFIKEGKSVFAKFVTDCDEELRPLDECLIVDIKDQLLAVGRCLLNKTEMLSFSFGMAVKTREKIT